MIERGATFSDCGKYRYTLWRKWDAAKPPLGWVMLNPSTAGVDDDPTIRKCEGFSRREGCGGLVAVNLFAYKATDPKKLWSYHGDPVGPENNMAIGRALASCSAVVFAWGAATALRNQARLMERGMAVTNLTLSIAADPRIYVLGYTKEGFPRHPLYMPYGKDWRSPLQPLIAVKSMAGAKPLGPGHRLPQPRQLALDERSS